MRSRLLGGTALAAVGSLAVAPAAMADGINLGLGGYLNTYFSVGGIDEASSSTADYNPTGLWSEGEIWFLGEYKHDNGITFGARVELEAFSTESQIDSRFIFVEGDFGRIEAGSRQSAGSQMSYTAPYAGLPINSGWITVFIPAPTDIGYITNFYGPGLSTYYDIGSGKENQITYYTPRFGGFQLGVTYIPTVTGSEPANFPVEADTNSQYANGVSVGVNYVQDFDNGIGIAISGGYNFAQAPDDTISSFGYSADDYQSATGGLNLSYAGFTVGGSYGRVFDDSPVNLAAFGTSQKGQSWDVGASYGIGPWTVGVTYFRGRIEGYIDSPDDQRTQALQGGVSYALGPGITAAGGIMWGKYETEVFDGLGNPDGTEDQSGVVGAAGLTFDF